MVSAAEKEAWTLDQLTKSEFFHQKLHEWGMLEVANAIEQVRGEALAWDRDSLGISTKAWDRVIHRGIKPVIVFAHPSVLTSISHAIGYYRMLAMVSQKSMNRVGLSDARYETREAFPNKESASTMAQHLNRIISHLIEADEQINGREFDLWRGMAAGSQAQGSWQNTKGNRIEVIVKGVLQRRIRDRKLVSSEKVDGSYTELHDGRAVVFADEPDVAFYDPDKNIVAAVEIKGGIDTAGVLERVGAAIKSLSRAKEKNSKSVTILILQGVSMTEQARNDLLTNQQAVNHWFTVEDVLEDDETRARLFSLLRI